MNRFFLGWVVAVLLLPSPVGAVEALVDALRALGQRNPEVANVLKQFNLL